MSFFSQCTTFNRNLARSTDRFYKPKGWPFCMTETPCSAPWRIACLHMHCYFQLHSADTTTADCLVEHRIPYKVARWSRGLGSWCT